MASSTPRRTSTASMATPALSPVASVAGPSSLRRWSPAPRRPSTLNSVSGVMSPASQTSSGRGHRRRGALAGAPDGKAADANWADMEPDEVFRRLPVTEVKRVEAKMRTDALNKQSELRSMVGTRYRDLLTSASQITELHSSSLRLSSSLRTVATACANPSELSGEGASEGTGDGEDVSTHLPAAAHVKLLLDAPEALYSYLAHHAYLNAAFLWLVARVVKDSLAGMPDDVSGPYLTLMQKQWEALLPFRAQIVQRATAALRTRDRIDTKAAADTLLAIILLDGLTLEDALDTLLAQRLRTLRDILAHSPTAKAAERRRRSSSRRDSVAKPVLPNRDDVAATIAEAVQCLLETERLARAVFEVKRKVMGGEGESVLAEEVRLVQAGEEQVPLQPTPVRTHNRRASRLASVSLPLPPVIRGASGPPTSAPRVLQTLPSSQILLRYLPISVTGFTPFITPSPAPGVSDKLGPWESQAVEVIRDAVPSWLDSLNSVADVWAVRGSTRELLADDGFEGRIWATLETEWGARVQAIWTAKLHALVTDARGSLQTAADRIRSGADTGDNDPASYLFTDIAFPSATGLAGSSGAGFNAFLDTLQKRAAYRTPQVDSVLCVLEKAAADIKADLAGLPASLHGDYSEKLSSALAALVQEFGAVLGDVGGHRDHTGSVEAELFVGRVALYLAQTSAFLTDLGGTAGVDLEKARAALMETHAESTVQWRNRAVEGAVAALQPLFDTHRGPEQVRASWQGPHPTAPSGPLVTALGQLVAAVRRLGVPPSVQLDTVPRLLQAFSAASRDLEWNSQKDASAAQAAFDLAFIDRLNAASVTEDKLVQGLLKDVPSDMSSFGAVLPDLTLEALRRMQVVLNPLVAHLAPAPLENRRGADARNAALLRLGAPALRGGVGADFKSPIAVARPGKRFGLLSIVA